MNKLLVIVALSLCLCTIQHIGLSSSALGQQYDMARRVSYQGKSTTCGALYRVAEDRQFAGRFQPLRARAVQLEEASRQLRAALAKNRRWDAVNSALANMTYGVEAFHKVVGVVTAEHLFWELVGSEIKSRLGLDLVGRVAAGLRSFANKTGEMAKSQRNQLKRWIASADQFAASNRKASNDIMNELMNVRRTLNAKCRAR